MGTETWSRKPPSSTGPASTTPPKIATRSRSPASPVPARRGVALASSAAGTGANVVADVDARGGLAQLDPDLRRPGPRVADDVRDTLADRPAQDGVDRGRNAFRRRLDTTVDPRRGERRPRAGELRGERRLAEPADRLADRRQRLARDPFDIGHLRLRPGRIVVDEATRELALEGDDGEAVTQRVVEVAGDPRTLIGDREPRQLVARGDERPVRPSHGDRAEHREADDRHRQPLDDGAAEIVLGREEGQRRQHAGEDHQGDRDAGGADRARAGRGVVEEREPARTRVGEAQGHRDRQQDEDGRR